MVIKCGWTCTSQTLRYVSDQALWTLSLIYYQETLAVHARKVQDVRQWFMEAFEGGPSGKLRKYRVSCHYGMMVICADYVGYPIADPRLDGAFWYSENCNSEGSFERPWI